MFGLGVIFLVAGFIGIAAILFQPHFAAENRWLTWSVCGMALLGTAIVGTVTAKKIN